MAATATVQGARVAKKSKHFHFLFFFRLKHFFGMSSNRMNQERRKISPFMGVDGKD